MGWVFNATPRPLYPRERSGTHCIGGWVGLRVGLDGCGKSRPPPGFDPRTVQPVASRYTDYIITAPHGRFSPGKNPPYLWYRTLRGAGLNEREEKILSLPGFEPRSSNV